MRSECTRCVGKRMVEDRVSFPNCWRVVALLLGMLKEGGRANSFMFNVAIWLRSFT
jgi:hypothetical protein